MMTGTQEGILQALWCRLPHLYFGIREPLDEIKYAPPSTIWQRIKQVFTGPPMVQRVAEFELCVLSPTDVTDHDRQQILELLDEYRPAGVLATILEFRQ